MKNLSRYIVLPFAITLLFHAHNVLAEKRPETISLKPDSFEHIQFKRIAPSKYTFNKGVLKADVDGSSSLLMLPFDRVQKIKQVSFEWRSVGIPEVKDAEQEATKKGDDSVIKVGLLLKADEDSFNPFVPKWLKRVNELLSFSSENMVYLVADSKHEAGDGWVNPYNKRVSMVPVSSIQSDNDWQKVNHQLEEPLDVVGIWIMADGDNTDSKFTSYLTNIVLK